MMKRWLVLCWLLLVTATAAVAAPVEGFAPVEGGRKAHLAGLSLGGRIASDFAVTYPDRVASLVLIGPGLTGFRDDDPNAGRKFWAFVEAARDQGAQALADLWLKDPYLAPAATNPAFAAQLRRLAIENAHTWLVNPLLERTPKPPTAERLAEIRVPTLLVLGSLDVPYIHKAIALLEKSVPGAKKVVIQGSGHMVNMEKPEEHDRALLGFLASLPKGSAGFAAGTQKQAAAEGYVPVGEGIHLHYKKVGNGPETVVSPWVTLHQVDDLSHLAEGRTLIFYSPRGRLRSDAVDPSQVSFENDLADLEAVRRHFGLEKMALLGWSHYGLMSAVYAARHPERVTRVVQMTPGAPRRDPYRGQMDVTVRERVDGDAWNALQKRRESGELTGKPAEACRAQRQVLTAAYLGDPSTLARVPLDDCDLPNEQGEPQQRWWGALLASMGAWDVRNELRGLRVPRLVVAGEKDFIPMAASREWVAGHPEARLLVLPGVGHFPLVEAPDRFLAAADAFLDGRWPEGAEVITGQITG
jgi:pimeloyl-ACP methyl ester carboxylesterase